MGKEIVTQVQETQRVPNRINPRRNTPRHILIKLTKIKHKEQILKAAREKQKITHKGILSAFACLKSFMISPSYLNEILAGYNNLGCRLFSFITLSMSCYSLLAWRVSIERSAVILMGIPLCVICCFSLAAFNICFNIFSLCLIFVNLINMCLGVFHLGFILFGTLWVSWSSVTISFPILGKFSTIISSSLFSWSFFLSSSGTPMIWMLGHLTLSQRSLRLSSFLLIRFLFFPLCLIYFNHSIFYLTYLIFCPHYSTVGSLQSVFDLIYCIIHYILTLFYFIWVLSFNLLMCCITLIDLWISKSFYSNSMTFVET